jgi:hypothetical protein
MMPVLSIIACEMLEDELVYILSKDNDLNKLFVAENRQCFRFVRKLKSENCHPRLFPLDRVSFFLKEINTPMSVKIPNILLRVPFFGKVLENMKNKNGEIITVVVNILKLDLHIDCGILRSEICRNIREMANFSDGILLFYGNCGHSLRSLEADLKNIDCSLYFLKDENGDIVDDCISVALGGNDIYAEVMQSGNGTGMFYLTPMWASSWEKMKKESIGTTDFDKNFLKNPLYKKMYKKVVKISNEISKGEEFDANILNFSRTFDMSIVEIKGSMEIARKSYLDAKNNVCRKKYQIQKKLDTCIESNSIRT